MSSDSFAKNASAPKIFSDFCHSQFAPLFFYAAIIFFVYFGDGVMSYLAPIYIQDSVRDPLVMGCVLSFSSFVGICCDTLFPGIFHKKKSTFFLWSTIFTAICFPLLFLLFPVGLATLLFGMAIWGVYFEFLLFSNYHFIHSFSQKDHHSSAWSTINTFRALGMFIAPIVSSQLYQYQKISPLFAAAILFSIALLGGVLFPKLFSRRSRENVVEQLDPTETVTKLSAVSEIKIWLILLKTIWPIYLFTFSLFLLEATFLSVGVLLSQDIIQVSEVGHFLIAAYMLPALFVGFFTKRISIPFGKKRAAFLCGITSGALLFISGLVHSHLELLIFFFLSAIFSSLALPEILSTIQDYIGRLGESRDEMMGLENSAGSLAYILGPIVCGAVAELVGNQRTFSVIGAFLLFTSFIALIVVPRKIRMPQQELVGV